MEKCIYMHCYDFISQRPYDLQHGFQRGKNCTTQLLYVYHNIILALDKRLETHAVHLDFSKAFDKVSHKLLLHKLRSYGFSGSLLKWFNNYSTNRTQRVVIDGCYSDWLPVFSGVHQGSILGPFFFFIFINDLPDVVRSFDIALYADDSKIFKVIKSCFPLGR